MQKRIQMKLNRRQTLGGIGAGFASLTLAGCQSHGAVLSTAAPLDGAALLDDIAWNLIDLEPGTATALGIDTGAKAYLRSQMADSSPAGLAHLAATLESDLARLRAFDTSGLDASTLTSVEVVESAYSTALQGFALPYGDVAVGGWRNAPYVVIQNVGAYVDLPSFFETDHPVRNREDAEAYLARLEQVPAILDGELVRMQGASRLGVTPPSFLLDQTIEQMEATIADAATGGNLVKALTSRTGDIPGNWEEAATRLITQTHVPAYQRQLAELKQRRLRATRDAGMWAQPDGEEWYAWALKASTTTTMSAEAIHELGKEELARLHARMEPLLQKIGYTKGSIGSRMAGLSEDPRYQFSDGDKGRAEIMAFIQQRIDWIKAQMPRAFRRLAPGNVEVRRIPQNAEAGAPSAYGGSGSIDGSIPGRMWINLRTPDLHRKYDLPTLVHHEAIPGHVWQGEYSNQLPLIRSRLAFNAFSEGWALYSEQMGDELGAYEGDPAGELGYLQNQAYRACRLVLDTGLHAKRWSREQAIDYFREEVGITMGETVAEVERYCSWPGQACGYMVGKLTLVAERERAQRELGTAYDLRDFNQAVVEGGNAPLDVVGRNITRYIERTKNA